MAWTVNVLNASVAAEVEALPQDMKAKLLRISESID